ncbi:helix-turn-helix domain-containing protein [Dickeya dadantii]|uniref:LexA family protein n=1 Tax=Dickeya dadantii TaxID=204038 RepID=UPI001CF137C5|nr:XRE family transcriptional regulator [Dickeya dadantii]MCA7012494.1 helix-turn-helix domain-containing protein [Dickeya dadantii]
MEKKKSLTTEQQEDAKRLKALYESKKKQLGITQQHIADELDITQGAVGHYLNGRNALNVPIASVFARLLQVSISDFSPTLAQEANSYSGVAESNVSYAAEYKPGKRYPLISNIQAGAWAEAIEPYTVDQIAEWYESDAHIQGEAFWLKVSGDSMTAPAGLSIPEGTLVLFDTGRDAINGSLVIAKLSDSNEATFKKLAVDGGQRYLKGLNPNWPIIPINGNCKIIGVAVETKMKLI